MAAAPSARQTFIGKSPWPSVPGSAVVKHRKLPGLEARATPSTAPMSLSTPRGRGMPRWSSVGAAPLSAASRAGLLGSGAMVKVGPPLSASGPSLGSVFTRVEVLVRLALASLLILCPPSITPTQLSAELLERRVLTTTTARVPPPPLVIPVPKLPAIVQLATNPEAAFQL